MCWKFNDMLEYIGGLKLKSGLNVFLTYLSQEKEFSPYLKYATFRLYLTDKWRHINVHSMLNDCIILIVTDSNIYKRNLFFHCKMTIIAHFKMHLM